MNGFLADLMSFTARIEGLSTGLQEFFSNNTTHEGPSRQTPTPVVAALREPADPGVKGQHLHFFLFSKCMFFSACVTLRSQNLQNIKELLNYIGRSEVRQSVCMCVKTH